MYLEKEYIYKIFNFKHKTASMMIKFYLPHGRYEKDKRNFMISISKIL